MAGNLNIDVKSLCGRASKAFSDRSSLETLWQDIAEQFYVERAEFTATRNPGDEFAAHLYSSYPLIVRRELANSFSSMLRPTNIEWFHVSVDDERNLSIAARQWLEMATEYMRKAMYERRANFVRATKEGDNDFATFGQCVISQEIDWRRPGLLYRNWHLRDVAWEERYDSSIGAVYRKWKPTLRQLVAQFGEEALHISMRGKLKTDGERKVPCKVITVPTEDFDYKFSHPYAHLIVDMDNDWRVFEAPQFISGYTIPRWQTVSGSQYAYSPATVAGLPDARLLQAITLTLLEAGEMAVRPPMIGVEEAIRSDMNLYAGGFTAVDADYDERMGDVMRPLTQDRQGLPFGMEMNMDVRNVLSTAFFLNKLTLPQNNNEMTAYETGERIREYIREALPLFEPMEHEYNGQVCEGTFDLMWRAGAFGSPADMPPELRGQKIQFKFESPLHDAIERQKGAKLVEAKELLEQVATIDPTTVADLDVRTAFRDALIGLQTPMDWVRRETAANEIAQAMVEQKSRQTETLAAQEAGAAAESVGRGAEALSGGA